MLATGADTTGRRPPSLGCGGAHVRERAQDRRRPRGVQRPCRPPGLLERLAVTRTERVTPLMFEQRLVERPRPTAATSSSPRVATNTPRAEQVLLRGTPTTVLGDLDAIKHRGAASGLSWTGSRWSTCCARSCHDFADTYYELRRHKACPAGGRRTAGRRLLLRHDDGLQAGLAHGWCRGRPTPPPTPSGRPSRVHPHRARAPRSCPASS